ncbi:hypothetical protein F5050DRAFT_1809108 [Lentinula boryana]|uniref:Uncharacterized protein n=1 Tax=Lentinula boryana TaxID=40481 RepID=A0ABQ8Q934_9AGAR|nr:hypothetical protein F5050DRAFT_1809108 [Lentinula boryana]
MDVPDLASILIPALYTQILDIQFPWEGEVDMAFASQYYFRGTPDNSRQVFDALHHQALKPISKFRPSIPDFIRYLPDKSSPHYPEHTLALILLLDQGPRTLYRHLDVRWTYDYFDVASRKVVKTLISSNAFPDAIEDWTALGYSFEDAMVRKFWLYGPLIHSEEIADHQFVERKIEKMRQDVENYTGEQDPFRKMKDRDAEDTGLFAELIRSGPPSNFVDFFFWLFRVFDAHRPIIAEYGRYPYRNEAQGRITTEEERLYLELTRNFGKPTLSEEEVETLRRQKESGQWVELSNDGPW